MLACVPAALGVTVLARLVNTKEGVRDADSPLTSALNDAMLAACIIPSGVARAGVGTLGWAAGLGFTRAFCAAEARLVHRNGTPFRASGRSRPRRAGAGAGCWPALLLAYGDRFQASSP